MDSDGHLFPASFEFKNLNDINFATDRMRLKENSHLDREFCLAPQFYFQADNNIQMDKADMGLSVETLRRDLL